MLPTLDLSLQFVHLADAAPHRAALPRHRVQRWLRHALHQPEVQAAEFSVRVVDEAEGLQLNQTWRNQDHATNVLTFDYAGAPVVVADLVLCAPVVAREAAAQGKDLQAHYAHLLVHGALHALGWDHERSEAEAEAMEAREIAVLAGLGFVNPYA